MLYYNNSSKKFCLYMKHCHCMYSTLRVTETGHSRIHESCSFSDVSHRSYSIIFYHIFSCICSFFGQRIRNIISMDVCMSRRAFYLHLYVLTNTVSVSLSLKAVETLWYNSSVVNDLSINSQVWFVSVPHPLTFHVTKTKLGLAMDFVRFT